MSQPMNVERWVELFEAIGLTEEKMHAWHGEFEKRYPEGHQGFLEWLGLPAEPMVLAVLFGANLCYVTPVAYQTNLLIMKPGGYRFQDYVRAGLPLALIMIVTLAFLLMGRYRL